MSTQKQTYIYESVLYYIMSTLKPDQDQPDLREVLLEKMRRINAVIFELSMDPKVSIKRFKHYTNVSSAIIGLVLDALNFN